MSKYCIGSKSNCNGRPVIFGQVPPGIFRTNHIAHQRQLQGRECVYMAEDLTIFIAVTSWKRRGSGDPVASIETSIVKNCKAGEPKQGLLGL